MKNYDVIIIGAGAAGLFCAIEAAKRQRKVLVLDHANKAGKKILMSGGGRCNFTNLYVEPNKFISQNPHFCKSALQRYSQWNFIDLVERHNIPYHEKTLGQLLCNDKSKDIVNMLLSECEQHQVTIQLKKSVNHIEQTSRGYTLSINKERLQCQSLVIATGGLSIPTMGASPFGYKVAEQFNLPLIPTRAGLVPFTLHVDDKLRFAELSGISASSSMSNQRANFNENILFTHRGLSGPAALQMSSYWLPGETVDIDLIPNINIADQLKSTKKSRPKIQLKTFLNELLAHRVVECFVASPLLHKNLSDLSNANIETIAQLMHAWQLKPNATEGYRTAEVTIGGVNTNVISSKTMEVNNVKGLYFIGEVLDVTGWLGGYNFQWAWSSGWAAGQYV